MGRKGDSKRKPKQIKSMGNKNESGSVSSLMQAADKIPVITRDADKTVKKDGADRKKGSKK